MIQTCLAEDGHATVACIYIDLENKNSTQNIEQVENAEVRKPKYGNGTETEVRK